MRLLLEAEADAVMAKIHLLLSDKSLNPFKFRRIQSRVLSGEEEGVFGWLAVNYLNNLFKIEGALNVCPLFEAERPATTSVTPSSDHMERLCSYVLAYQLALKAHYTGCKNIFQ